MADELLDAVLRRGQMDLIRDYALPIPTMIIAEMLGIPVRRPAQDSSLVEHAAVFDAPRADGMLRAIPERVVLDALHAQADHGSPQGACATT